MAVPPGSCPARRAIALARAGRDLDAAVGEAERALADPACRHRPGCVFDALSTLVLAGELAAADRAAARLGHHDDADTAAPDEAAPDERLPDEKLQDHGTLIRARTARWRGDLDTAWELYDQLHRRPGSAELHPVLMAETAELLLCRGRPVEANALLAEAGDGGNTPELRCARGLVAMDAGDFRAGLAEHLAAGRQFTVSGVANPAVSPWRRRAAWCAHACGNLELAADLAREDHEAALAWGEPRVVGETLAGLALLAGDGPELDLLCEAAELLEAGAAAIEAGEARYELGRRLLEAGRPAHARVQFTRAATGFRGAGNRHRTARVAEALRGCDPRPGPALTPIELKVAFLALANYRNQDIAAKQFLAVRTVEFHLSQVYRKLGIRGRDELQFPLLAPENLPAG
ncbi:helix-turn-helix transcriptional regulator [Amycolatopsis jiangsuensis]|uniref:DNA-binding CsgD family transcriptional regulator n=1 Tax=Amycolatopsis jiangsuensis TaxID=1181879 RepID=A0A840ISQ9_9PSEU|nr:helix-turn-helix transcriptional regulator [Amycolatopsis jiangsuensis]MBB4684495.1 DNA-binding CsgD family transcriptional regulator [Amycolatopsis jiangsuensis]